MNLMFYFMDDEKVEWNSLMFEYGVDKMSFVG